MKIGIFDSGIGGITVLHEVLKLLPNEDYIYYADTLNVPYGPKPKEEVKKYVFHALEFLVSQKVQAVVIACNTATSIAIEDLRAKYSIPILGMEPAVKPAVEHNKDSNKRVLVTATALTLKEEKLKNLISKVDSHHIVELLPLPELVRFAEGFVFEEETVLPYLQRQLSAFELNRFETVVLGCTHFPFYKDIFRKLLPPSVSIIDGAYGTARNLYRIINEMDSYSENSGSITFYNSGIKVADTKSLNKYRELFQRLDGLSQRNNQSQQGVIMKV
jgi:glutamate racemase